MSIHHVPDPVVAFIVIALLIAPAVLRRWDVGAAWCEALRRAGVSHKEAAYYYRAPAANFSRVLSGAGPEHLSEDRLSNLPDRVWLHYAVVIAEMRGYLESADTRAVHALRRLRRQAGAGVRRVSQEATHAELA